MIPLLRQEAWYEMAAGWLELQPRGSSSSIGGSRSRQEVGVLAAATLAHAAAGYIDDRRIPDDKC